MKFALIREELLVGFRTAGVCGAVLSGVLSPSLAHATNIQVTSNSAAVANDGVCTLPEAVTALNFSLPSGSAAGECAAGNGSNDQITLMSSAQTYVLSNNLHIFRNVTLQGAGTASSIVKSTAARAFDVHTVNSLTVKVTIKDLTVQNGRAASDNSIMSGLYVDDRFNPTSVILERVNFVGCLNGVRLEGAGDLNEMLRATRVSIQNSRSDGVVCRGCAAVFNASTVTGSKGRGMLIDAYSDAGTRLNSAFTFIDGAIESNGSSSVNGGGVSVLGGVNASVVIDSSSVSGNTGADGGGMYSEGGGLAVFATTIAKNAAARGGGIFYGAAPADTSTSEFILKWSTIARNTASNHGGGIHTQTGRNARIDGLLLAANQDNGAAPKSHDCLGDVRNENDPNSIIGTTLGCSDPVWLKTGDMALASDLIPSGAGNGIKILPLLKTSNARDAAPTGTAVDFDTRGMQRPQPNVSGTGVITTGSRADVGAYEWNQSWPSAFLNVAAKSSGDAYVADGEYYDFKPNADGDQVTFAVPVTETGVYNVINWVRARSNGGNYTLEFLNSAGSGSYATISNKDLYSAASSKISWTGQVTIPAPGLYYFRFRVIGKNGSSGGRQLDISSFTLVKQ